MNLKSALFLVLLAGTVLGQPATQAERYIFKGLVDIELTTIQEITAKLENAGCQELPATNQGCYFEERILRPESSDASVTGTAVPVGETGNESGTDVGETEVVAVFVYPEGPGFGPASYALTETRLFAVKDLETDNPDPEGLQKFRDLVRTDISVTGNPVKLIEDSWLVLEVMPASDVVYSAGSDELQSFVEENHGAQFIATNNAPGQESNSLAILGIVSALIIAYYLFAVKRKK